MHARGGNSVGSLRGGILVLTGPLLLLMISAPIADAASSAQLPPSFGYNVVTVDATAAAAPQPFPHFWSKSFGSGHARLTLRDDWRSHMQQATEEMGLSGVRHHGLFDDDMGVVIGHRRYNFSLVVDSWEFQVQNGVTPIVELSFMPAWLAGATVSFYCQSRTNESGFVLG